MVHRDLSAKKNARALIIHDGPEHNVLQAEVMASALLTDPRWYRLLAVADPIVIELLSGRALLTTSPPERNRLTNRMREQLWRYFPAMLELELLTMTNTLSPQDGCAPLAGTRSRAAVITLARCTKALAASAWPLALSSPPKSCSSPESSERGRRSVYAARMSNCTGTTGP
jgi:hypothetical protein